MVFEIQTIFFSSFVLIIIYLLSLWDGLIQLPYLNNQSMYLKKYIYKATSKNSNKTKLKIRTIHTKLRLVSNSTKSVFKIGYLILF